MALRLGEILVEKKLVTADELNIAITEQQRTKEALGQILVRMGFVVERDMLLILAQQQASDQWAFYQAKVIREHIYRGQKMRLELDLLDRSESLRPEVRKRLESLLQQVAAEEERYRTEKKEIEKEAKKLEHERDVNRAKDPYFDYAEVLLQIAIVMSSIAIIAASRQIFCFALASAALGALLSLNGFLLIFHIPFFHY